MDFSVCDSDMQLLSGNHDSYERQRSQHQPGHLCEWLWDACMCSVCVCSTACVPESIMAPCMAISSHSALPPCWLRSFIRRGAIIPFHISNVPKYQSLFACECALCCFIKYVVLWIGGSCFHFAVLKFMQNSIEFCLCQDCFNRKKSSNFWRQCHNGTQQSILIIDLLGL